MSLSSTYALGTMWVEYHELDRVAVARDVVTMHIMLMP